MTNCFAICSGTGGGPGADAQLARTPRTLACADGQQALQVCVRVCKHVCTLPLLGGTETLCWGVGDSPPFSR